MSGKRALSTEPEEGAAVRAASGTGERMYGKTSNDMGHIHVYRKRIHDYPVPPYDEMG